MVKGYYVNLFIFLILLIDIPNDKLLFRVSYCSQILQGLAYLKKEIV